VPILVLVGWTGQSAFFIRSLYQWLASERAGASLVPRGFWLLSILGSCLLIGYAWGRADHVILTGQLVNLSIYLRNQVRTSEGEHHAATHRLMFLLIAGLQVLQFTLMAHDLTSAFTLWLLAGWTGQMLFQLRFPMQWWVAEKRGGESLPAGFWWLSIAGSGLLLAYALQRHDAVIAAGQAFGWITYSRNLVLKRKHAPEPCDA
jgi:lipid-A-disaccharide synthase-like uncharacterized protein